MSFRVITHVQVCPDCGSTCIDSAEVETGDGLTETALTCRDCGTAWPLACVCDWDTCQPATSSPATTSPRR